MTYKIQIEVETRGDCSECGHFTTKKEYRTHNSRGEDYTFATEEEALTHYRRWISDIETREQREDGLYIEGFERSYYNYVKGRIIKI